MPYKNTCLLLILLVSCLACTSEDDGTLPPTIDEQLRARPWIFSGVGHNALGRATEIAELFTEAEINENGFSSRAELAARLDTSLIITLALGFADVCDRNDVVNFMPSGELRYDFIDDCLFNFRPGPFDGQASYTWSLTGDQLLVEEFQTITSAQDSLTASLLYTVVVDENSLVLRLGGNDFLLDLGFITGAEPDINKSYNFVPR